MPIDYTDFAFGKGMPRSGEKVIKGRAAQKVERKVRQAVNARDKHRCFFPGCKVSASHKHHTVYRSRGGSWDTKKIVSGCPVHHRWIHDGLIELHGNPDKPPMQVRLTTLGRKAKLHLPARNTA